MKTILLTVVFVALEFSSPYAQPPTDAQIEQVLREPPTGQLGVCFGNQRSMQFEVCAEGPLQRIAIAARNAKKSYQPFELGNVANSMRENVWMVFAVPTKPVRDSGEWHVTPAAKEALFQPSGQKDAPVVRPVRLTVQPQTWSNALGGTITSAGFTATFNPDDLPPGQLDLIILTSAREQRYVLSEADRARIR
jgi:hypothetical protein